MTTDKTALTNDRLRERSYEFSDEPIVFFCECGDPHCFRPVWLTADEFDRARALGEALVVEHAPQRSVAA